MYTVLKNTEARLVEIASSIKGDGHYAMLFHFHKLLEHYRSPYQIKIAVNVANDFFRAQEGGIFACEDGDLVIIYKGEDKTLVERVIFQLRYLFVDDPLAYNASGEENPAFCSVFDISFQWKGFYEICKNKLAARDAMAELPPVEEEKTVDTASSDFKPSHLAVLEQELKKIDFASVIRKQPVCALSSTSNAIKPIFHEIYVHIAKLAESTLAHVDLLSNRALFKYLTEVLDIHVLRFLKNNAKQYLSQPVSINLNINTILSDAFTEFDVSIDPKVKSSIIIELQIGDVFDNNVAFVTARNILHRKGYRVCLDGLNSNSFTQIEREKLGFDLAKVYWSETLPASEEAQLIQQAVKKCGPNRIILCRCGNQNAIQYGHDLGLSLFQGRQLDKILSPEAVAEN